MDTLLYYQKQKKETQSLTENEMLNIMKRLSESIQKYLKTFNLNALNCKIECEIIENKLQANFINYNEKSKGTMYFEPQKTEVNKITPALLIKNIAYLLENKKYQNVIVNLRDL